MFKLPAYLKRPDALSPTEAATIYQAMHTPMTEADADFQELWGETLAAAITYATLRANWNMWDHHRRGAQDALRTRRHNEFMQSLVPLNRLTMQLGSPDWLQQLGDPAVDRKRIGDFAGYIVLFGCLQAR